MPSAPTTDVAAASTAQQVGDGVKIGTIDTDFTQGGLQTTGINTNLAINGNGFFTLNNTNERRDADLHSRRRLLAQPERASLRSVER